MFVASEIVNNYLTHADLTAFQPSSSQTGSMNSLRYPPNAVINFVSEVIHQSSISFHINFSGNYVELVEAGTSTTSAGVVGSGGAGGLQNLIRAYQAPGPGEVPGPRGSRGATIAISPFSQPRIATLYTFYRT